ncbi:efflux RND transporter periplasmic adaptor subunit [Rhizobium sp. RM]|uniref:efflux RND transporter periplasmic adaptor subunit n=1 Tax=Rhizobium sp. RM TaxID=2748079 RepID=UPI00110E0F42|nr:efflux RND transporter periplasmic adaptor subunit [Rhizobium sp. RM]TMV21422.1 efflux RND transporter periplasmic adaptor subunit [Rhizobium sp. Td3]
MQTWNVLGLVLAIATVTPGGHPAYAQDDGTASRGIVKAVNQAMIGTDLSLPIVSLPFREGQDFSKGDVLAAFDCRDLEAQVKSAEAVLRAETITHENNMRLARSKAVGSYEVDLSKAKTDQAAAELEAFRSKMARCVIRAPYDGRVAFMRANEHEIPEPNQPLMQVVSTGDLEIETLLPSPWLRWLKPGAPFTIAIDETGEQKKAEVARIAATVDPVSQTVKVTGRFSGDTKGILPGMSGATKFNPVPGE